MPLQCPHCRSTIILDGPAPAEVICPSCGSSILLDPSATAGWLPDEAPKRLGKFEFLELLGVGSFGAVYKARDTELGRLVALKIPRGGSVPRPEDMDRFLREARSAAALRHPGIVALHDAGAVDGTLCIVSEFIPGATLAQNLTARRLGFRAAAQLVAEVADALHYAHQCGVVHRDIKPSNIMLDPDGRPHLMDFGLAKRAADEVTMTLEGQVLGTPAYMAPEQARGEVGRVDARSDVYGLGVILYELLTGELPFRGHTRMLLVQVLQDEPRPPRRLNDRIPRDLETICLKAMAKEPSRRYASAADFATDLRHFLAGELIHARPVGAVERFGRWCRRNRALATAGAALVLTLAVGSAVSTVFALAAGREARRAEEKAAEASRERDAARTAERESRQRMVRLHILTGTRALDAGDPAVALLWFHQAWEHERDDPDAEPSHRARLAGLLQGMPDLVGACFHPCQVHDAAFSPDGRRVLSRSDGTEVYLWDYEACRQTTPPLAHTGPVRHACWSPDGSAVATASADGSASLWDATTGTRRHALAHGSPVTWVAFHPQGDRLVTAAEDGSVRLWEVATGRPLEGGPSVGAVVEYAAFSPDGTRLVTAARDDAVRVWALDPPRLLSPPLPYRVPTATERYRFHFDRWPRFAADGRTVVTSKGENLIVWPGEGSEFKTFPLGYGITEIHPLAGTDRVLATGDKYNRVAVVSLADGSDVYALSHPRQANVGAASPDGKYLMTASSGGLIHLRDATDGRLLWPPQKCGDFASAVAVSADGRRCLAASQDGTVRVWAVAPPRVEVGPYQPDGHANQLTLPAGSGRIRSSSPDGARFVEYGGPEPPRFGAALPGVPTRPLDHAGSVATALFADDGSRFVVFGPASVRAYDARSGEPAGPLVPVNTEGRGIGADRLARLSRDGSRVAVWDNERTVSVWDLVRGVRAFGPVQLDDPGERIFGPPTEHGYVTALVLSSDGGRLAAATDSAGALTVWEVDGGRVLHHTPKRYQGYAQGFAFSADGRRILLWASDNNARAYDAATGEPLGPAINPPLSKEQYVRVHPNECAISADGRWLAFYESGLGGVRLYDARRADSLLRIPLPPELLRIPVGGKSPIARLWFSPDGARLGMVAGGVPSAVALPRFALPTETTAALVRLLTGQRIDATDGLERIDPGAFRIDPEGYRRAFLAWKGRGGATATGP